MPSVYPASFLFLRYFSSQEEYLREGGHLFLNVWSPNHSRWTALFLAVEMGWMRLVRPGQPWTKKTDLAGIKWVGWIDKLLGWYTAHVDKGKGNEWGPAEYDFWARHGTRSSRADVFADLSVVLSLLDSGHTCRGLTSELKCLWPFHGIPSLLQTEKSTKRWTLQLDDERMTVSRLKPVLGTN